MVALLGTDTANHPSTHHQGMGSAHLSCALGPGQERSSTNGGLHSGVIGHHHATNPQSQFQMENPPRTVPNLKLINQNCDGIELLILALTFHDRNALLVMVQDCKNC